MNRSELWLRLVALLLALAAGCVAKSQSGDDAAAGIDASADADVTNDAGASTDGGPRRCLAYAELVSCDPSDRELLYSGTDACGGENRFCCPVNHPLEFDVLCCCPDPTTCGGRGVAAGTSLFPDCYEVPSGAGAAMPCATHADCPSDAQHCCLSARQYPDGGAMATTCASHLLVGWTCD